MKTSMTRKDDTLKGSKGTVTYMFAFFAFVLIGMMSLSFLAGGRVAHHTALKFLEGILSRMFNGHIRNPLL